MTASETTIPTPDGAMPAHVAEPDAAPSAAIIVLHQAGGLGDQVRARADRFAADGYLAVAPDLFHRKQGEPIPFPKRPEDFVVFDRWLSPDAQLVPDIQAALDWIVARGIPLERIGVVGYSYGGRAAYLAAVTWPIGAAVTYYGNGVQGRSFSGNDDLLPLGDRPRIAPWLGLYGELDGLIPPAELDAFQTTVAGADVPGELVRYPDAGHGFDVETGPAGANPNYAPEAAADAAARTDAFFAAHLGGRGA